MIENKRIPIEIKKLEVILGQADEEKKSKKMIIICDEESKIVRATQHQNITNAKYRVKFVLQENDELCQRGTKEMTIIIDVQEE